MAANSTHEPIHHADIPMPSARSTGFVFAAVAVIVAAVWRQSPDVWPVALGCATVFASLAQFAPKLLDPLNRLWFQFALLLNTIMSPVVMLVLYIIAIVPMGLAMQCVRDPLTKRRPTLLADPDTYWVDVRQEHASRDMRNQF